MFANRIARFTNLRFSVPPVAAPVPPQPAAASAPSGFVALPAQFGSAPLGTAQIYEMAYASARREVSERQQASWMQRWN